MASGTTVSGLKYPIAGVDEFNPAPDMQQGMESVELQCLSTSTGIGVSLSNPQPGWSGANSTASRRGTTVMVALRVSYTSNIGAGRVDITVGQVSSGTLRPIANIILSTLEGDKAVLEATGILRITQVELDWTAGQQRSFLGTYVSQQGAGSFVYDEPIVRDLPPDVPGPAIAGVLTRSTAMSIPTGALGTAGTKVVFDAPPPTMLRGGMAETSDALTVPVDGRYRIFYSCSFAANTNNYRYCEIKVNGVKIVNQPLAAIGYVRGSANAASGTGNNTHSHPIIGKFDIDLLAGDVIDVYVGQNSGAALNLDGASLTVYKTGERWTPVA